MLPGVCPGRVYDFSRQSGEANHRAVVGTCIGRRDLGRGNAEPAGLHLHHAQQVEIILD